MHHQKMLEALKTALEHEKQAMEMYRQMAQQAEDAETRLLMEQIDPKLLPGRQPDLVDCSLSAAHPAAFLGAGGQTYAQLSRGLTGVGGRPGDGPAGSADAAAAPAGGGGLRLSLRAVSHLLADL